AFRVASATGGGRLVFTGVDGSPVYGSIDIPNTGGWQSWETLSFPFALAQGQHRFEIHAEASGWNINWFELRQPPEAGEQEQPILLADFEIVEGEYGDGEPYSLRRPIYEFGGVVPEYFSVRVAPQLVGLGLLEALDESLLLSLADPCDEDEDGISGRVRVLSSGTDPQTQRLGRFGLKGGQPSVLYQIAAALNRDMGVTSSIYPVLDLETGSGSAPELSDEELEDMRRYISLLGVPARRALTDTQALRGEELFTDASCDSCHKIQLVTGSSHPYAELREQTIRPFTDLLLHDMGEGLADSFQTPSVMGAEWRTAPLWGIGLSAGVSGAQGYLHDGRARSLDEAILWHGGEAEASKEAFRLMPAADRQSLIRFLESI
ncbi:MAG: carbohydrate-binding protein, partial [Deltaproteobacteria bacterium]|nr:carbohydrate-binding protein [Deltaproteobacteria bacterium]